MKINKEKSGMMMVIAFTKKVLDNKKRNDKVMQKRFCDLDFTEFSQIRYIR